MKAAAKILLAAAVAAAAAALLLVLFVNARARGRMSHCRNNLRHLGGLAARNWPGLDPSRTGRAFWQGVREVQYRTVKGEWRMIEPDPFLCPVYGKTESRPGDASAIDYRGPKAVRDQLKDLPRVEPLGADRPGNHPSGGHLLRLDTSVEEMPPVVEPFPSGDPAWQGADRFLSD